MAVLEKKIDQEDRGGKIGEELLKEGVFVTFDLLGQALADVPVGDVVFEEVAGKDQGNGEKWIVDLGGDKGAGGCMCYREHLVISIL